MDLRAALFGSPIPLSEAHAEKLNAPEGVGAQGADTWSSMTYGPEAILTTLIRAGGLAGIALLLPVSGFLALLVSSIVMGYILIILAFPEGGGSFAVTRRFARWLSKPSGAAIIVDYVLTVPVSISALLKAIYSVKELSGVYNYRLPLAIGFILLLAAINLRGTRAAGKLFKYPTFAFIGGMIFVVVFGELRLAGAVPFLPPIKVGPAFPALAPATTSIYSLLAFIWLILRAVAAGCTALTGIEAISTAVKEFRSAWTAVAAMLIIAAGVIIMLLGISHLSYALRIVPDIAGITMAADGTPESLLSKLIRLVVFDIPVIGPTIYYIMQGASSGVLFIAANASYVGFPAIGAVMSQEKMMPRWMQNRGNTLVHGWSIMLLTVIDIILITYYQVDEERMLPLYALGVMFDFTAGLSSLSIGLRRLRDTTGWMWKSTLLGATSIITGVVFLILLAVRWEEGSWIVLIVAAALWMFISNIEEYFANLAEPLSLSGNNAKPLGPLCRDGQDANLTLLVPIYDLHRGALYTLDQALNATSNVCAVHVAMPDEDIDRLKRRWARYCGALELKVIETEYSDVLQPIVEEAVRIENSLGQGQYMKVWVPQFEPPKRWQKLYHSNAAWFLERRLKKVLIEVDRVFYQLRVSFVAVGA